MKFRKLCAEEIECRVQSVKTNGIVLLLYKDARVDQRLLDETVGAMNWQRHHSRDNANCVVSIWDSEKNQWVEKEDTGTESNTEAQKGLASDSFKRACFNWGIGRELYSAPFIWITDCEIKNGKCYDRFYVSKIGYADNGDINELEIKNSKTHKVVFPNNMTPAKVETKKEPTKEELIEQIMSMLEVKGISLAKFESAGGMAIGDMPVEELKKGMEFIRKAK